MKTNVPSTRMLYALATTLIFTACQKTDVAETNDTSTAATIAVAASISGSTAVGTDSIYLMQSCGRGGSRDSIAQSALPATALAYIQANYSGSVFSKAFVVKNSSSAITGYVAIVYYSDNPVGLLFDNTGAFVRVLEQREKGDLNGAGHHRGGRFEHRDGKGRDSVALIALPATVTAWFAANFSTDTLVKAFKGRDSILVVLSKNNGVFATVFSAANTFVKREQLSSKRANHQAIELAQLPAIAANYLSQTYPNYVFEKAFSFTQNGAVQGYVVVIVANNTRYAIEFDVTGNFVRVKTIH